MTNTELAELLLTTVFDTAEKEGHHTPVPLVKVAQQFGIKDAVKVYNLAKFLESRGLIDPLYTNLGPLARITGEGAIFVERGGDTGIIPKYRKRPSSFVVNIDNSTNIYGDVSSSNIAVSSPSASQSISIDSDVEGVINQIGQTLKSDSLLSQIQLTDALHDLETLKLQLMKSTKNKSVIESILANMASISSIGSFVAQLAPLIFKS